MLLEEATGLMTGSIYGSERLLEYFYGETRFDDGSTIVQKTRLVPSGGKIMRDLRNHN